MADTYNINVDFREFGQLYYHAYTYVTKIDPHFKPVQAIPVWIIYSELVLVRPYMLSNEMLPINPKSLVPPKNSLVLSKTKSEPLMNLFCLVKNKPWKARGISSNGR